MYKLFSTALFLALCCSQGILAQSTSSIIQLSIANNPNAMTQTGNIRPTADGTGYLIVGTTGTEEYARALVIKTDLAYKPVWSRRLDFPISTIFGNAFRATYGIDIADLGDGSYALLANINRNVLSNADVLQNLDYALVRFKVANSGTTTVQWAETYGGDFNDVAHMLLKTSDGNLLVSGYSNPEYALNVPGKARAFLVKTSLNGQNLWRNTYWNGECNTTLIGAIHGMNHRPVIETSDGGYVFATICEEWIYLSKIGADGVALWTKQIKAGNAIGDALELAGIGGIGGAVLSGGTISGIQELPNGELAFMGNYVIGVVAFAWDNNTQNIYANGVGIPMGVLFTTSSTGAFKNGQVFFHERFGDSSQPTEMLCHDFKVLPDGKILVVAGVGQYINNYSPAVLTINTTATAIDQAVVDAAVLDNQQARYNNNDNARGQSQMQLIQQPNSAEAVINYNLNNILLISDVASLPNQGACMKQLDNVRSLPIQLDVNDCPSLAKASLPKSSISVNLTNRTVLHSTLCTGSGLISSNENESVIQDRSLQAFSNLKVSPNPNNGIFSITTDEVLLGDETISIQLMNAVGQLVYSEQLDAGTFDRPYPISISNLANGIYFLHLTNGTDSKIIRVLVQK